MFHNTLKCFYVFSLFLVNGFHMAKCNNRPITLDMNELPTVRIKLSSPPLSQIVAALLPGLSENFETVSVKAVQCPDLTQPPFNLAAEGLSGNETLINVGSPSYLLPLVNRKKLYDMRDLKQLTECDPLFLVGAGSGSWPSVGVQSQLSANVRFTNNSYVNNLSHCYKVNPETGSTVDVAPITDTRFAPFADFFTSNGLGGVVVRIECETRKGPLDFVTSIRNALEKYFGDEIVSLGGVFLIENGKVRVHVTPDFLKTPFNSESDLNNSWLKFNNISTPLVGLGYLISPVLPGSNLRPQHFHLFSNHGVGGHYHHDIEPSTIKYTAYLNVAKNFIRIDQP